MKNLKKLTAGVLSIGLVLSPVSQISHAEGESLVTKPSKVDTANEYMSNAVNEVNDIMKKCEKSKNNSQIHKILDAEIADTETKLRTYEALLANAENDSSKDQIETRIIMLSFKKETLKETKRYIKRQRMLGFFCVPFLAYFSYVLPKYLSESFSVAQELSKEAKAMNCKRSKWEARIIYMFEALIGSVGLLVCGVCIDSIKEIF